MNMVRELPSNLYDTPAYVFCGDRLAGELFRHRAGATFRYREDYLLDPNAPAIAHQIPKANQEHGVEGVGIHPFFANLLPEGWILEAVATKLKTSRDDLLSLLIALGQDTIGDVWLDWERNPPPMSTAKEWNLAKVTFDEILAAQYADPNRRPEPVSIPGVQEKVSANRITILDIRMKGKPAIIKLNRNPLTYPKLVENEAFFMDLASKCGLQTPRTKIIHDVDGNAGLWVERFDREMGSDGSIRRLHMEDFCQLTNRYPKDKYNMSAAEVVATLNESCSAPKVELLNFLRLYAFSWMIGNGDLHGKNISVLTRPDWLRTLSPTYDMLTTIPYKDRTMAFQMDGRAANLKGKHFLTFGARHGLPEAMIRSMIEKLIIKIVGNLYRLPETGFDEKSLIFLRSEIERRLNGMADFD